MIKSFVLKTKVECAGNEDKQMKMFTTRSEEITAKSEKGKKCIEFLRTF